jgi:ribose 5-phosphate isomerase B
MRIAIGADHAGFAVKEWLRETLTEAGHMLLDQGCFNEASVDYPDHAHAVARSILSGEADRGILICGTGIGMSIAANRHKGIRAALCTSVELSQLSREHNDANVLCVGARTQTRDDINAIVKVWLETEWAGGRHAQRITKLDTPD